MLRCLSKTNLFALINVIIATNWDRAGLAIFSASGAQDTVLIAKIAL
tara:strand:- start:425 stop:565 length:141 start_codon:yes stop_codon:yes gene_type:complete